MTRKYNGNVIASDSPRFARDKYQERGNLTFKNCDVVSFRLRNAQAEACDYLKKILLIPPKLFGF
jgi:hypothetical protein